MTRPSQSGGPFPPVFSLDHKVIGIQYAITSMVFLLIGFTLMLLIRWQLAYPGSPLPIVGGLLGESNAPGGVLLPEFYNQLGAMHGTIMILLGVVPLSVGGFGNYLIPLQIGAPDMAFPRLNMLSYWICAAGGAVDALEFLHARRRGTQRLDVVPAALGHLADERPDDVLGRHAAADRVVALRVD